MSIPPSAPSDPCLCLGSHLNRWCAEDGKLRADQITHLTVRTLPFLDHNRVIMSFGIRFFRDLQHPTRAEVNAKTTSLAFLSDDVYRASWHVSWFGHNRLSTQRLHCYFSPQKEGLRCHSAQAGGSMEDIPPLLDFCHASPIRMRRECSRLRSGVGKRLRLPNGPSCLFILTQAADTVHDLGHIVCSDSTCSVLKLWASS